MIRLLALALAGAFGTLARYGLTALVGRHFAAGGFPWGTVAVNALGCLGFGLVISVASTRSMIGNQTELIILTGFFGAFTTFSTFHYETARLINDVRWMAAAGNLVGQNILGVLMLFIGLRLGRFA